MRIIVGIVMLIMLASCGGGGSTAPPIDDNPVLEPGIAVVTFHADLIGWEIEAFYPGLTIFDKEVVWTDQMLDYTMTAEIPYDGNKGRMRVAYTMSGEPSTRFNVIDRAGTYDFTIWPWFSE